MLEMNLNALHVRQEVQRILEAQEVQEIITHVKIRKALLFLFFTSRMKIVIIFH